ncbi:unnamed protein product, partial [marine sediment metagenome]
FAVETVGVGRKDYSQSVELSVEPEIRSHQYRYNWTVEATLDTYEDPEDVHFTPLLFQDRAGNILDYVPSDVKYLLYDVYVSGDYNALTIAALEKHSYPIDPDDPDASLLDPIAIVFGYGSAKIALSEGHICEQGRVYLVSLNQWCEKPTFTVSFIVHAYTDLILG